VRVLFREIDLRASHHHVESIGSRGVTTVEAVLVLQPEEPAIPPNSSSASPTTVRPPAALRKRRRLNIVRNPKSRDASQKNPPCAAVGT